MTEDPSTPTPDAPKAARLDTATDFLQRHRGPIRGVAIGATSALALIATLVAGVIVSGPTPTAAAAPPAVTVTAAPLPEFRDLPAELGSATPIRTCSIDAKAADGRLGNFSGYAINAATGEVLFNRKGGDFVAAASTMKVVTAAAALAALGPDYRIPTRVYRGAEPGSIYLVGYGDPTITRMSSGSSYYAGAARLSDLAAATAAAYGGGGISRIYLDSTYFDPSDTWLQGEGWYPLAQTIGDMAPVTALQVDADRDNPTVQLSRRSSDPVMRAGSWFKEALPGAGGAQLALGAVPDGAELLAEVYSPTISQLLPHVLRESDNQVMEALARITAVETGFPGTFDGLGQAVPAALSTYGIDTAGLRIRDGSGVSSSNGLSAAYVARLMVKVQKREGALGVIDDGLPVAGRSGTLATRFGGENSVAAGKVRAKTGTIDYGVALSGVARAEDGSTIVFAYFAVGPAVRQNPARAALDTLTVATYRCGANLSNF